MNVKCFLLSPVGQARLSLRRYSRNENPACNGNFAYHDATIFYMDVAERKVPQGETFIYEHDGPQSGADLPADTVWPTKCQACGYHFTENDHQQIFTETLYSRSDNGEVTTARAAGPGAIYDAEWLHGNPHVTGPDGKAFIAICPDGAEWLIDGPANNGPGWTRTGEAPNFTVTPSIQTAKYHGWLRNGEFVPA